MCVCVCGARALGSVGVCSPPGGPAKRRTPPLSSRAQHLGPQWVPLDPPGSLSPASLTRGASRTSRTSHATKTLGSAEGWAWGCGGRTLSSLPAPPAAQHTAAQPAQPRSTHARAAPPPSLPAPSLLSRIAHSPLAETPSRQALLLLAVAGDCCCVVARAPGSRSGPRSENGAHRADKRQVYLFDVRRNQVTVRREGLRHQGLCCSPSRARGRNGGAQGGAAGASG